MPIYVYRCSYCGEEWDFLRPVSEREVPAECKACGCPAEFILSAPNLKADGAYSFNDKGKEAA